MSYFNFNKEIGGGFILLDIEKKMTLETLLKNVSYKMRLKFEDYNAGDNNCQDFMKNVIYVLCAKRHLKNREMHIMATLHIPFVILEIIEENEKYGCYKKEVKISYYFDDYDYFGNSRNHYYISGGCYGKRQPCP